MAQDEPFFYAFFLVLDVFVLQHTQIGGTDEGVDHELDEVLHFERDGDATNFDALLGETLCAFDDSCVFVLRKVVTLLGGAESAADFWKERQ